MAEYRTITIDATISPDISVTASVKVEQSGPTAVGTVTDNTVTAEATVSPVTVDATASIVDMTVEAEAEVVTEVIGGDVPTYQGDYVITPTEEAQTLPTKARALMANIVVEAIPSNYGRISWDGRTLTVS